MKIKENKKEMDQETKTKIIEESLKEDAISGTINFMEELDLKAIKQIFMDII